MNSDLQKLQSELLRRLRQEIANAVKVAEGLGIKRQTLIEYGFAPIGVLVAESKWAQDFPDADLHAAMAKARLLEYRALVPNAVPDAALPGLALCLSANHERANDNEDLPSRLVSAAFGHGLFQGVLIGTGNEDVAKRVRSDLARTAARARVAASPKHADKAAAFREWQAWQSRNATYKSGAAFARHIVETLTNIESTKTVERWVTAWRKAAAAKRNK